MVLIAIDLILLGTWQGLDPMSTFHEEFDLEEPQLGDERDIMIRPYIERCSCSRVNLWLGKVMKTYF